MQFQSIPLSSPLSSYEEARKFQLELVEKRVKDEIPDTVLFLEHRPVITRGRGLQFTGEVRPRHMPLPRVPEGVEFCESERGGDLTYHGPGQLVIYPICKLDGEGLFAKHDVAGFIRAWEKRVIQVLGEWGLRAEARAQATGVWVGEKKLASIGVAVKKWVTYHGIALNCVNDLTAFREFSPCGFDSQVMGRVLDLLPATDQARWQIRPDAWREEGEQSFQKILLKSV